MDEIREILQQFSFINFLKKKLLLLVALVCEILALLIDKGILTWDPQYEGRLTVCGVVLMLIWLVMDGLQRKYKKMEAAFRANMAADEAETEE